MSWAYYNEFDANAAAWLRELIKRGLIADGEVDTRSIVDVRSDDLRGFIQLHFFAGIGGWSHALRLAGWPDDRPVWTGSCPCQPFSAAGKRKGEADERHLWPELRRLVSECNPAIVVGEQVASRDGRLWLANLRSDMEALGYAVGAADLCAAGVGAPHIRQRLFWGAQRLDNPASARHIGTERGTEGHSWDEARVRLSGQRSGIGGMDYTTGERLSQRAGEAILREETRTFSERSSNDRRMAHAHGRHASTEGLQRGRQHGQQPEDSSVMCWLADADDAGSQGWIVGGDGTGECPAGAGRLVNQEPDTHAPDGFWRSADWLFCRDERWRPVEPGTFPLADGLPARVGRLRGYGNAIVPQVAAQFIRAFDGAAA